MEHAGSGGSFFILGGELCFCDMESNSGSGGPEEGGGVIKVMGGTGREVVGKT